MTYKTTTLKTAIFALILCLAMAGSAAAAPSIDSSLISWDAAPGYELILTVSGDGEIYRYEFAAGEPASLSITDAAGQLLADGNYTWQLSAARELSKEEAAVMAQARAAGVALGDKAAAGFTDSGYFTVAGGAFATPTAFEGGAEKSVVVEDDQIVQGSQCVGLNCTSDEDFSFDTVRLKESNLRIKFEDTSTSANFPSNDWQLTVNDSESGGANRFSIDDVDGNTTPFTIEAGAPDHTLYLDRAGRLGVNTSTPVTELHLRDGNTPTIRLEQDGSAGFESQTWDIAGNEVAFFVRDLNGAVLPFKIQPNAGENALVIEEDTGDIGIGTDNPRSTVEIMDDLPELRLNGTTSGEKWEIRVNNAGRLNFQNVGTGNNAMQIDPQASANLLQIGRTASDQVDIAGSLTITGTCNGCDAVFTPEFPLETIEEHAELMWKNSYLPGVGPTQEGPTSINVFEKTTGILQELEKAHIYIEQLHNIVKGRDERISQLEEAIDLLMALGEGR